MTLVQHCLHLLSGSEKQEAMHTLRCLGKKEVCRQTEDSFYKNTGPCFLSEEPWSVSLYGSQTYSYEVNDRLLFSAVANKNREWCFMRLFKLLQLILLKAPKGCQLWLQLPNRKGYWASSSGGTSNSTTWL